MSSVSVILRLNKPLKDGTYPLAVQVIKDRKKTIFHIGYSVSQDEWDEDNKRVRKSHPNSVRLNNLIQQRLAAASDTKITLETDKPDVTVRVIKEKIKPSVAPTFFPQAQDHLDDLKKGGKYNSYTSSKPRIAHFKQFLKGQDIAFADITPGLLEKFAVWLKHSYKPKGKKKKRLNDRSIINHWVTVRSVFAHARKNKVIGKDLSPFGKGGLQIKFPDTLKIPLSLDELATLEGLELPDARHEHVRKLWLFAFYFAGMRGSDVLRLKWSDFQNYRLYYKMGKNDKGDSLKIPDQAIRILKCYEQFKESDDDFVFPELKGVDLSDEFNSKRIIGYKISAIDKMLNEHVAPAAGITKKLTMHIARHTFADLAGGTVDIQKLQKLYRHTKIETTIGYQGNFIHQDADDALDAVHNRRNNVPKP
jgi:site-specific recombinase XerD